MVDVNDTIDFIVLDQDYITSDLIGSTRVSIKDMLDHENTGFYVDLFFYGRSAGTLTATVWKI